MGIGWFAQVLLARQMEQSVKDFAAWRKNREREVAQLRRQGRKQAAQVRPRKASACPVLMHCTPSPCVLPVNCCATAWPRCLQCLLRWSWPDTPKLNYAED